MPGCTHLLCCYTSKQYEQKTKDADSGNVTSQKLVTADSGTSHSVNNTVSFSRIGPSQTSETTEGGLSQPLSSATSDASSPQAELKSTVEKRGNVTVIKLENNSPNRPITVFDPTRRFTTPATLRKEEYKQQKIETQVRMASDALSGLIDRLESVTSRLEKIESQTGASGGKRLPVAETAEFVKKFDDIISGPVAKFVSLGKQLGDETLSKQLALFCDGFKRTRAFLDVASRSKRPAPNVFTKLVEPIGSCVSQVQEIKEKNRSSKVFNHLSALSEAVPVLGWITVEPKPAQYVTDMMESAQFYINRVIKDYKDSDPKHCAFIRDLKPLVATLTDYIKDYHTTGVMWNPQGGDAAAAASSASTGVPPPPPGGAPPPPPPPAVQPPSGPPSSGGDDAGKRAELFAALNQGVDITKSLKKVTDDMKTHKNPALRTGPAPYKPPVGTKPVSASKPKPTTPVQKPPVFELQGKKWVVEHHVGNRNLVIDQTETKQSVYIFKCTDSIVVVKNKVNSIIMDGCKKCAVVCDSLVSSLEFINCASVKCQVDGVVPTVSIDKTDGCQVYLSKNSLDVQIVTAKSSEMNVLIPKDDGDYVEYPIPEQLKTSWNGKTLNTTLIEAHG